MHLLHHGGPTKPIQVCPRAYVGVSESEVVTYQVPVYTVHVCAEGIQRTDAQRPLVPVGSSLCADIRPLDGGLATGDGGVNLHSTKKSRQTLSDTRQDKHSSTLRQHSPIMTARAQKKTAQALLSRSCAESGQGDCIPQTHSSVCSTLITLASDAGPASAECQACSERVVCTRTRLVMSFLCRKSSAGAMMKCDQARPSSSPYTTPAHRQHTRTAILHSPAKDEPDLGPGLVAEKLGKRGATHPSSRTRSTRP